MLEYGAKRGARELLCPSEVVIEIISLIADPRFVPITAGSVSLPLTTSALREEKNFQ